MGLLTWSGLLSQVDAAGGGPMLSIPIQGSMPMGMSMQQGVYGGMGGGQPPMYMAGPPYSMHPGAYSHLPAPSIPDHYLCLPIMPERSVSPLSTKNITIS